MKLNQWSSDYHRRGALTLAVCSFLLLLAACLPVRVGDPEQSRVDPRLHGAWLTSRANEVWFFRRWDARTWLVTDLFLDESEEACDNPNPAEDRPAGPDEDATRTGPVENGEVRRFGHYEHWLARVCGTHIHKGWLTALGGRQFLVMEPAAVKPPLPGQKDYAFSEFGWFVYGVEWPDEDTLVLRQLNPEYMGLGEVASTAEAERIISENADDPALYVPVEEDRDSGQTITRARDELRRASSDENINIQRLLWIHMGYSQ